MTRVLGLPIVSTCTVSACAYNHDGCRASAITVAPHEHHAGCMTYAETEQKGGTAAVAAVGACSRADCAHNESLACTAEAVEIGPAGDVADCLTYQQR